MAVENVNTTSSEPELLQTWLSGSQLRGFLPDFLVNRSIWQYVIAILLGMVVYDQGNQGSSPWVLHPADTSPVLYIKRKGSIAGPSFKIPLMGPFLQAIHPKFEAYLAQWASGPLSCVSVFHK